ncbi:MAG: hypothetical protein Tsb002_01640 [Wenzhouxiangellaceae bacterium]
MFADSQFADHFGKGAWSAPDRQPLRLGQALGGCNGELPDHSQQWIGPPAP